MKKHPLDDIIEQHYAAILRYCQQKLPQDVWGAQDCTQEVFLLLVTKREKLDVSRDIAPWLYAAADRVLANYRRRHPAWEELVDRTDTGVDVQALLETAELLDVLDDAERQLFVRYYAGEHRKQLAEEEGLSLESLYVKMSRIRQKILAKYIK